MGLKLDNSPLFFIDKLLSKYSERNKVSLEFSIYASGGEGITLLRKIFRLELNSSIWDVVQNTIETLDQGCELAIHSVIFISNEKFYLPFIDFATPEEIIVKQSLGPKIKAYLDDPLIIFSSGRSFHGYSQKLLTFSEWIKFLGFALLLNPRKGYMENIDSRWIGHSLEQGFGSLRLSANTKEYLKLPEFIGSI